MDHSGSGEGVLSCILRNSYGAIGNTTHAEPANCRCPVFLSESSIVDLSVSSIVVTVPVRFLLLKAAVELRVR